MGKCAPQRAAPGLVSGQPWGLRFPNTGCLLYRAQAGGQAICRTPRHRGSRTTRHRRCSLGLQPFSSAHTPSCGHTEPRKSRRAFTVKVPRTGPRQRTSDPINVQSARWPAHGQHYNPVLPPQPEQLDCRGEKRAVAAEKAVWTAVAARTRGERTPCRLESARSAPVRRKTNRAQRHVY